MKNNNNLKKIFNFFFSLEMAVILSLIFMAAMIWATIGFYTDAQGVKHVYSMTDSWKYVYETKWFEAIMWLLGINLIGVMFRYKTYKKMPIFVLHLSIIVILLGAAVTRYVGYEGQLHLRDGETKSFIMVEKSKGNPSDVYRKNLGFEVRLDRFVMHKYPGSMMPSSYDSYITIIDKAAHKKFQFHIYMNHILVYKGYRFYQESYDPDEKGSILSVNHDPGMYVTYFGYILLAIGFLWSILYKKSRFMITVRKLQKSGLFSIALMLLLSASYSHAFDLQTYVKKSLAPSEEWAKVLVQENGRIEPMDTLDLDLVHKISKKSKILGMNYNQIVAGMVAYTKEFQNLPLIYVGHPKLRQILGIKGKYATYNDFFLPNGQLRFQKQIDEALRTPDKDRTQLQREYLKINERIYVSYTIYSAAIFHLFPIPKSAKMNYKWFSLPEIAQAVKMNLMSPMDANFYYNLFFSLAQGIKHYNVNEVKQARIKIYELQKSYSGKILPSKSRIKWEIIYNRLQIFPKLIGYYLLIGLIGIILGFIEILRLKKYKKTEYLLVSLGTLALLAHTANMFLRWYISGHAPWTDAYESIIFIAWGAAFASLVFFRKSMLAFGAGFFVAGMFMFVAHLSNIDPQITNTVPVLKSYWLLIHVSVITSSYGFLAVGSMLGLLNIILFAIQKYANKDLNIQIKQMNNIVYLSLYMGLALLTIGTFLGGVWANESWGRYWSWDPKETWSLISIVVFALVVHTKMIPKMRGEFIFSLLAFLSFFFILMTYFGVNFYIAQGLHSYGQDASKSDTWIYYIFFGMAMWFAVALVTLIMGISQRISKPVEIEKSNEKDNYHPEFKN